MALAIDTTLLADLKRLEGTITTNEREAILARWDSGRRILAFYAPRKKQLPNGLLDAIADKLGVVRSDVGARIKFAKKYRTKAEFSTVVETYRSWSAIRQQALTDAPRPGKGQLTALQRAFKIVENIDSATLDNGDLALIGMFTEVLQRLASNIVTLKAA